MTREIARAPASARAAGGRSHRAMRRASSRARARRRAVTRVVRRAVVALACVRARAVGATTAAEEGSFYISSHVTNAGALCEVKPYGWYCPNSIEYSYDEYDWSTTYEGTLSGEEENEACAACATCAACGTGNATCAREASAMCFSSCDALGQCDQTSVEACKNLQFEVTRMDLKAEISFAYEFFVNEKNGSDEAAGTREAPWATLARAQRRVRFLRAVTEASGLGRSLVKPVHVWVREVNSTDPGNNLNNGRYSGLTYY